MHPTLTWQSQPKAYTHSSVFVAEVASSCHEALLRAFLAHALDRGVLAGEEGAAERCLAFLAAGDSIDALDALRGAGVDLGSPEPVERTFAVPSSPVDRIEELVPA